MDRTEFEQLRDLPDKVIRTDIRLTLKKQLSPVLTAENIAIENTLGLPLQLTIKYNPEVGSKHFNVAVKGIGPICRLDVDDNPHGAAGRSHKHALRTERCSPNNLPNDVAARPELDGKPLKGRPARPDRPRLRRLR